MQWLNEPVSWQRAGDVIKVSVDPGTDFWWETGYGYIHDSGHVYGKLLPGDLDVSVRVRATFTAQYDQAGIMLRVDERAWLITGVQLFEGRLRLSTVLTLGRSSWMVADLPADLDEITLRVSRRGEAVEVRYSADSGVSELAALVFLPPGRDVLAGVMCAAPEGNGFSVTFRDLRIVDREGAGPLPGGPAEEEADEPAPVGWEGDEPGERAGDWAEQEADEPAPVNRAGEPGEDPGDEAVKDWDRLLRDSTAREHSPDPAGAVPGSRPFPAIQQTERDHDSGPPAPEVNDLTQPDLARAEPAGQPHAPEGTGRAKPQPARPVPQDPADEWISLLTGEGEE